MRFEFATATRIVFGAGTASRIAPAAGELGRRALFVTGLDRSRSGPLLETLRAEGIECVPFNVAGEPTVDLVRSGSDLARREDCDLVIGLGGGSSIDTGKAISAIMTNPGEILDYLEVIGKGRPLTQRAAPFLAVPTTAGTGAEVTRNAVLASPEHKFKVSLRSPLMLPQLAVVDPEFTYDLPAAITAGTGLDALTQLIEPYVSKRANPLTDSLCLEGMGRAARSLSRAYNLGHDAAARSDMCLASLMGGLALANAGLGVVHGFAAPIGGMFPAPHGAVCAALLPHGMRVNIAALHRRADSGEHLRRYETVAGILTGRSGASAERGVEWVQNLCRELRIPPLGSYGISAADIGILVEKAANASSMKANPVELSEEELREVLSCSL